MNCNNAGNLLGGKKKQGRKPEIPQTGKRGSTEMTKSRCRDCGSEFDKEKTDQWNIRQEELDPVNQRHPNTSNCPICYSSEKMKVWRFSK